jgi:glycerophosphoryl diester phosphodiesterase
VFSVNHPEDIRKMNDLGVDGVFTDYPERVLKEKKDGHTIGWI